MNVLLDGESLRFIYNAVQVCPFLALFQISPTLDWRELLQMQCFRNEI